MNRLPMVPNNIKIMKTIEKGESNNLLNENKWVEFFISELFIFKKH